MVMCKANRSRALGREKRSEALPLPIGQFKSFAPAVLPHFAHRPQASPGRRKGEVW